MDTLYARRNALGHRASRLVREGVLRSFHPCPGGVYLAYFPDGTHRRIKGLKAAEAFIGLWA
jgi:hypothetical protein